LIKPLGTGDDELAKLKISKGSLKGIRTVEPVWVWPITYNSIDPLSDQWYRPETWLVMSKPVHKTRLLTFIAREVPDLLKPAYMFGGQSLTQLMMPVVENWLTTRRAVGEIVKKFSFKVIYANVTESVNTGNFDRLRRRMQFFNQVANNDGTILLDKTAEEFINVAVPLGGLDQLQAQAQEHMASLSRIPIIKLLGVQPAGLNASSEGELRSFEENIHSYQEAFFRPNLERILNLVQCSLFGSVDPDITFVFEPLTTLNEKERAELQLIQAQTAEVHLRNRSISRGEERDRITTDPETPYAGLEKGTVPDLPADEAGEVAWRSMQGIVAAFEAGLFDKATALREIKGNFESMGLETSIDDGMITEAENEPPTPSPDELKAQAMMVKAEHETSGPSPGTESPKPSGSGEKKADTKA
jgi:uncharacterized protein